MKKTILTITGIRPDFIRMSEIFKKLDNNFNHILVHTGQHYDKMLSDVFFDELSIRKPDYNLEIGSGGKEHFYQQADLSIKIIELLRNKNINPDLIIFLGDSNSALASVPLKKEGYKIAHIEAGMRSGDKRMFEEINRIVCDHCSDFLFVYHDNYKQKLINESIKNDCIFVVGNTIKEVAEKIKVTGLKENRKILLDIHRPENFNYEHRLKNIIKYANICSERFNMDVEMLSFGRTISKIREFNLDLGNIKPIELLSFKNYINEVYHSFFIISDSGTAQEEPSIFKTPVIVPRNFTERPESIESGCSYMLNVDDLNESWIQSFNYLNNYNPNIDWLGDGKTSDKIIKIIKEKL
jgi:UDP-N-acetylglucosamine 2-epimerase (non-hydrolysing)